MPANVLYTDQAYAFTEGKILLATRVYIAAINTAAPGAKIGGTTPASYTDLGSIVQSQVTLDKADSDIVNVETGLFEVLRDQIPKKDGVVTAKWTMAEYEPAAWAALTGDALVGGNSIFVGGRPLIQKAVLFIGENPATGTQFQHYNPKSNLMWKVAEVDRFQAIEVTATLLKFTDGADSAALSRDFRLYKY